MVLSRAAALKAPVLLSGQDYEVTEFIRDACGTLYGRAAAPTHPQLRLRSPAAFMAANAAHALMVYDVTQARTASGHRSGRDRPGIREDGMASLL